MTKSKTFVIEVPYSVYFNTAKAVPIDEIIDTLVSMERLLLRTPKFIETAYKGIHVIQTEVLISSIVTGSLTQDFIVKYILGGEDNAQKAKEVYDTMVSNSQVVKTVVAVGVGSMIGWGIHAAVATGAPTTNIEAYNSTIIHVSSGVLTGDQVSDILSKMPDKKRLAQDSVIITKTAKSDPSSTIKFNNEDALVIPAAAISEAPSEYTPASPQEREIKYQNVELIIHASDRDKTEAGWAGIIPNIVEKRMLFKLAEGLDPAKIHGRLKVRADVLVHERFNKTKKTYEPKSVEILAIAN